MHVLVVPMVSYPVSHAHSPDFLFLLLFDPHFVNYLSFILSKSVWHWHLLLMNIITSIGHSCLMLFFQFLSLSLWLAVLCRFLDCILSQNLSSHATACIHTSSCQNCTPCSPTINISCKPCQIPSLLNRNQNIKTMILGIGFGKHQTQWNRLCVKCKLDSSSDQRTVKKAQKTQLHFLMTFHYLLKFSWGNFAYHILAPERMINCFESYRFQT